MEESAAIKNIVNVSCRLGYWLILRSSPDSVCQDGLIGLAWKELARNQIMLVDNCTSQT